MTYESAFLSGLTEKVLTAMEAGPSWIKPWVDSYPYNAYTKKPYRGVNLAYLAYEKRSMDAWATPKQWKRLGTEPKESAKPSYIYTQFPVKAKGIDELSQKEFTYTLYIERFYEAYCADQVIPKGRFFNSIPVVPIFKNKEIESLLDRSGAEISYIGNVACYMPSADEIYMPRKQVFKATKLATAEEHFYATFLHEMIHWTGHVSRLGRIGVCDLKEFSPYEEQIDVDAFEELVAEIGAAIMCKSFGLISEMRDDHINYLASWISHLKERPDALILAINMAQNACDYLFKYKQVSK